MTIRLFRCVDCGHKMRLGSSTCGYCHTAKGFYQRPRFYIAAICLPLVGGLAYLAVI